MNQKNQSRLYAAFGIAGQVGFLSLLIAVGSLVVGVVLDKALDTKHLFALIFIVVSVPINLFVTLRLTQRMIARVIPPDKPTSGDSPDAEKSEGAAMVKSRRADDGDE